MEIRRLGTAYDLEKVEDVKKLLAADLQFIAVSDKNRKITQEIAREAEFLKLRLLKMEQPQTFESQRNALKQYCENTHIFE